MAPKGQKQKPKPPIPEDKLVDLIYAKKGILAEVARTCKITRIAIWKRVKNNKRLEEVVADARDIFVDLAESQLHKKVKSGDRSSIHFTLKCLGKDRGYIERKEITGKDGAPVSPLTLSDAALEKIAKGED